LKSCTTIGPPVFVHTSHVRVQMYVRSVCGHHVCSACVTAAFKLMAVSGLESCQALHIVCVSVCLCVCVRAHEQYLHRVERISTCPLFPITERLSYVQAQKVILARFLFQTHPLPFQASLHAQDLPTQQLHWLPDRFVASVMFAPTAEETQHAAA